MLTLDPNRFGAGIRKGQVTSIPQAGEGGTSGEGDFP